MILPDASVWIDHLKRGHPSLDRLLENGEVLCHPFVIGEVACGDLRQRQLTLRLLQTLEEAPMMEHEEVLALIERHRLVATGIGWVDAHLLGSTLLAGATLWTLDTPLARAAARLSVLARP
jgi:predicted nucleic acid-binding protein